MPLTLHPARPADFPALQQLLELYQYELSDIWLQDLDAQGRYGFDLTNHWQAERFRAYIAREGAQYVGFALTAPARVPGSDGRWMDQFFILKRYRRTGAGRALARHVFASEPGPWQVGQMSGNTAAQAFWRQVIGEVTHGQFTEVQVSEGDWQGVVQHFHVVDAS